MNDVQLYDGCYVKLADGSVCGPVSQYRDSYYFTFARCWWSRIGKAQTTHANVNAVYPSLSDLAKGEG